MVDGRVMGGEALAGVGGFAEDVVDMLEAREMPAGEALLVRNEEARLAV